MARPLVQKTVVSALPRGDSEPAGRVLVADDQADVRTALTLLLRIAGYEVHAASSPAAILEAVARQRFDLLLMDLNYARATTSGREGLEVLPRVRALDPALPIVAMTAWSNVPLAVATLQQGVGDFVEKPWDNARLLDIVTTQVEKGRLQRRARRLESDAREVQARLLGLGAPAVEGYDVGVAWSFAEDLGGDAHEIVPLSDGRLVVAIADVCGKGLAAALLMSSLDATLREAAAADLGPRDACLRIAFHMGPRLGTDRFVSAVYAVLDRSRGTLTYVNAGHPPPILLRADGQTRRLARGGPVVGVPGEVDYEEGVLALRPGDRLVLFTDGVLEAAPSTGEEFGDERILRQSEDDRPRSAAAAARVLLETARDYAGGPLTDDATALVVSLRPPGA